MTFLAAGLFIATVIIPLAFPRSGAQRVLEDAFKAILADQSPSALYAAAKRDPSATVVAFVTTISLTLALLAVPLASFRYKRWLLAARGESYCVQTNLPMTCGTHELERTLQERAGSVRPAGELPFDLICLAVASLVLFPLWLMLGFVAQDRLPATVITTGG